jgi:hypothetical protein
VLKKTHALFVLALVLSTSATPCAAQSAATPKQPAGGATVRVPAADSEQEADARKRRSLLAFLYRGEAEAIDAREKTRTKQ